MATFVSLISGSSGNATFVSDGKTNLLIDCGMSGAKLKESLHAIDIMPESIDALLITHEHDILKKYGLENNAIVSSCIGMENEIIEKIQKGKSYGYFTTVIVRK